MKVLFVSSGKNGDVSEIVKNQGDSLANKGIEVEYYLIKPGLYGYITSIPKIRKKYKIGNYDLVHAHYSLSAFSASLAGRFPLVVSLMGSDVYLAGIFRLIARFFILFRWNAVIVKSAHLKEKLNIKNAYIVPNGVNMKRFAPIPANIAREKLGLSLDLRLIAFIAYSNRPEKNLQLATESVKSINHNDIVLKHVSNVPNDMVPYYLNASDILLLTSKWEGSPNVIKEAMACNCPIVASDVGDIRWLLGETEGCYLTSFNPADISEKIVLALDFAKTKGKTNGRNRIIELDLDDETVALKIQAIYSKVLKR